MDSKQPRRYSGSEDDTRPALGSTRADESPGGTMPLKPRAPIPQQEPATVRTFRALRSGTVATGKVALTATQAASRRIHKSTHAGGAGESGLAQLIELHAVNALGDMLITLSLANSLFFSVQPGAARGKVALYLLITMVPFVVLAPVIGPLLDRLRSGRRTAIAVTMLTRTVLAWIMAGSIHGSAFTLYPAAFGCLIASKAYGVTRSAAVPRVLPPDTTLVKANSRAGMAGLIAATIGAPVGAGLAHLGAQWSLRAAALFFILGTLLAVRLPARIDSAEGEEKAQLASRDKNIDPRLAETMPDLRLRSVGPSVLLALRANAALRGFSGFLTMFLAFIVRSKPIGGLKPLVAIALVAGAATLGSVVGTALGSRLKSRAPEAIITALTVITTAAAVATTVFYGAWSVLGLALVAGIAQTLGKLSLDALLQRETLERVRTSAFARSETLLQLAWVVGGGLGIALSYTNGVLGFGLAGAVLVLVVFATFRSLTAVRRYRASRPLYAE